MLGLIPSQRYNIALTVLKPIYPSICVLLGFEISPDHFKLWGRVGNTLIQVDLVSHQFLSSPKRSKDFQQIKVLWFLCPKIKDFLQITCQFKTQTFFFLYISNYPFCEFYLCPTCESYSRYFQLK